MPVPTLISSLSQTPASNSPPGTESPTTADDYLRQYSAFIASLRDGVGFTNPVILASGATTDIGAQNAMFVEITGTATITSFGVTYRGPRFLRFTGATVLTHNATTLNLPGAANITTVAGDTAIVVPNQALNGWNVVNFVGANAPLTAASINSGPLIGNRIINGAQEIDQVNDGAAVTPGAAVTYLTDMFQANTGAASKLTFQQVADAPAGLKNSMKITVAAQYAPAAGDAFALFTGIEGGNVIDFQLGTAGAATITLSNWIKGSVAGTYAVSFRNAAFNRSYVGTVTVTTSWAPVKITLTGDTAGTWLTDTGVGLFLWFDLGSGTNFNTTANAWQAGNFVRTAGSVTFVNQTAGSTLNITGVDCRLGSTAPTVFERRMNELQLCQRYLEIARIVLATAVATTAPLATAYWKVTKRVPPTLAGTFDTGTGATFQNLSAGGTAGSGAGRDGFIQANAHSVQATAAIFGAARLF